MTSDEEQKQNTAAFGNSKINNVKENINTVILTQKQRKARLKINP